MLRYLGLVWDSADPAQTTAAQALAAASRSSAHAWSSLLLLDGLAIFCADTTTTAKDLCVLPDGAGAILGPLFRHDPDQDPAPRETALSRSDCDAILSSRGRKLIESYWGNYVAFLIDARSDTKWIVTAPSQAQEFFTTQFRGVHLCFSSMDRCPALDLLTFTVNWRYVRLNLVCHLPDTRATGLNEVTRLMGGESLEIRRDSSSIVCYWHPFDIASAAPIENMRAAVQALRRTTQYCVDTWASRHEVILHTLSGGLDSSVVLACLRTAPTRPQVSCLNYFIADDPHTDEREYARLAARRAGVTLWEREVTSQLDLEASLPSIRHPCPQGLAVDLLFTRHRQDVAEHCGATGLFDGNGGDEVLGDCPPSLSLADYSRQRGMRPSLLLYAWRNARPWGMSTWDLLCRGIRANRKQATPTLFDASPLLLTELTQDLHMCAADQEVFQHPWFSRLTTLPPGKLAQIQSLARARITHSQLANTAPECIHPLASQPVAELCLRIPSYFHTTHGWTRAVARRAFEHELPGEVVWRRGKSGMGVAIMNLVQSNIDLLRSMLLDGALVTAGVLQRSAIQRATSGQSSAMVKLHLLHVLAIEVWLRKQLHISRQPVAG